MLHHITRGNSIFCFHSILGILYFLHFHFYAKDEDKMHSPRCPKFKLDCSEQKEAATYTRLYTRWLFSGGADPDLARVHNDGTISFQPRTRNCMYWTRRHLQMGAKAEDIVKTVGEIVSGRSNLPAILEAHWTNLILRTEPIEKAENIWIHALPTHTPSTTQQPQPTPHPFNTIPTDVPHGWITWKPLTVPPPNLPRLPPTHIDPIFTAPAHTRHIHFIDRRRAQGIPNITFKEDATPAAFDLQDLRSASRAGALQIRAIIREQLSHTVAPPNRASRRRKREIPVPLNFATEMFQRPTDAEEYDTDVESEDEVLEEELEEWVRSDAYLDELKRGVAKMANVATERDFTYEFVSTLVERKRMGMRKMELLEEAKSIGVAEIAATDTLFVVKDWV